MEKQNSTAECGDRLPSNDQTVTDKIDNDQKNCDELIDTVHHVCMMITDELIDESKTRGYEVSFDAEVVAQVAYAVYNALCMSWSDDLLLFAKHGKRVSVNMNDVRLLFRNNKSVIALIDDITVKLSTCPKKNPRTRVAVKKKQPTKALDESSNEGVVEPAKQCTDNTFSRKLTDYWDQPSISRAQSPIIILSSPPVTCQDRVGKDEVEHIDDTLGNEAKSAVIECTAGTTKQQTVQVVSNNIIKNDILSPNEPSVSVDLELIPLYTAVGPKSVTTNSPESEQHESLPTDTVHCVERSTVLSEASCLMDFDNFFNETSTMGSLFESTLADSADLGIVDVQKKFAQTVSDGDATDIRLNEGECAGVFDQLLNDENCFSAFNFECADSQNERLPNDRLNVVLRDSQKTLNICNDANKRMSNEIVAEAGETQSEASSNSELDASIFDF